MTAPSYTTDLALIDDAEAATSWYELGAPWNASLSGPADETENYIANVNGGAQAISCTTTKTGISSMVADYGSGISWTSGDVFLVWVIYTAAYAMTNYATGGLRAACGSGLSDFDAWDIGGNDRLPYPKGGWMNIAVDPEQTPDDTVGTPTASPQYFGVAVNVATAISKGYPFVADVIRYGRGDLIMEYGDSGNGYCTFAGASAYDENTARRWGLLQSYETGYLWKGLMSLGTATNAVDMRVPNGAAIFVQDCPKVYAAFNAIEVNNASSRVDWTNVSIESLGTQSKGTFEMKAAADVNFDGCVFKGMGAWTCLSSGAILNSTFINCGQIDSGGADFSGSVISGYEGTSDTAAFVWDVNSDPNTKTDGMTFTKGTASTHAIEFGTTSPTTMALTGIDFSGYNASNGQTDSTFYIARTGGTVTINVTGCTGNITYKSAGATVVINSNVTVTFTGMKDGTEVRIYSAGTSTELAGIETVVDGTPNNRTFAASIAASTSVDYWIFAVGYESIKVKAFSWPSTAQSLPQQQRIDRNYENP